MTKSLKNETDGNTPISLDENLTGGLAAAHGNIKGPEIRSEDLPIDAQKLADSPGRVLCGDIDMRIAANGTWFYLGSPIGRKELIKLFSSIIWRDNCGNYWMVTPAEMARIIVDDAPFTAVEIKITGTGENQSIYFRTNVDTMVLLDDEHPLRIETDPKTEEPRPYITVEDRLEALIVRSVFYQLVEVGVALEIKGEDVWGVWSNGFFYPIGPVVHSE